MEGMNMTNETIKPMRNMVAIEMIEIDETTKSGLVIARLGEDREQPSTGIVYATGPKATECKQGDKVLFKTGYGAKKHKVNGKDLILIPETEVVGVFEG